MSVLPVGIGNSGGDYTIEESLRFNASQSSYLSWTPASAGNRKTWTFSAWVKYSVIDNGAYNAPIFWANGAGSSTGVSFEQSPNTAHRIFVYNAGLQIETTQVFRDPSSWYHIVAVVDNTQATSSNRTKLYINGVQVTSFTTASYPAQNTDGSVSEVTSHTIGQQTGLSRYFNGYITEVNFIDGQALDASSFGEFDATTGVWKPAKYTGTYGTNGFYLPMKLDNTVEGFNTVTYIGNGSTQQISGTGFSPDLVWIKSRTEALNHAVFDSVRGATQYLSSNTTTQENSYSNTLTSFNTDGFSVGNSNGVNDVGDGYVAWCWDAGNTTVSNTDGSITSTVRANPTYGFSVVSYVGNATTNASIGHGLGTAPDFIIHKNRSVVDDWSVWSSALPNTTGYKLLLNSTSAQQTTSNYPTLPTSSVFYVGAGVEVNGSGNNMIAYCFSEVSGYSKFGSYTGNGSTSGPTITTGWKPAMVLIKCSSGAFDWWISDTTRSVSNTADSVLLPNSSSAEINGGGYLIDFLDTGFQLRNIGAATNGSGQTYIYMAFKDTREYAFWLDDSGNNNDWQPNGGITTLSTVTDTPTLYLGGGNYATLNPLRQTTGITYSNGNLECTFTNNVPNASTIAIPYSGKWYFEGYTNSITYFNDVIQTAIGLIPASTGTSDANAIGLTYAANGKKVNTNSASTYAATYTAGDIIGVGVDMDAATLTFYKNGVSQGVAFSSISTTTTWFASVCQRSSGTWYLNFGQRPFAYTPPTGFLPLHTGNLPDSSIVDGSKYFDATTYTGNNTTNIITNSGGFKPDFVWIKSRSVSGNHSLFNSVSGANKVLSSSLTMAEETPTAGTGLLSFDSSGFTLGADIAGVTGGETNGNGFTLVGWQWKANGTGVTNTDGSITSTVSANPTAGFSIVTYTGTGANATVGHGLGVAPSMLITKSRTGVRGWPVYSSTLGIGQYLELNTTIAAGSIANYWGANSPTSTVFSLPNANYNNNVSGENYVAYCFAEVEGYSRISSFVGNGSTDGPFVYCGFRPQWLLFKNKNNGTTSWYIFDAVTNTYNVADSYLRANLTNAEATLTAPLGIDFTSNGFKVRDSAAYINNSGNTIIYMAFAENPFKNSLAR